MSKSVLEMVQCLAESSIGPLDKLAKQGFSSEYITCVAMAEQVRATYCLATVLARIHEVLSEIEIRGKHG